MSTDYTNSRWEKGKRYLWQRDKTRQKCEISACPYTAEKLFPCCFTHRRIAFARGGYKGGLMTIGNN